MGGGQSAPLDNNNKNAKNWEKERENQENGKMRKNLEGSFTLPLLTDRAGYATMHPPPPF